MSADNYYEINTEQQAGGAFRFGVNMGSGSDDSADPLPNGPRTRWFDDLSAAIDWAAGQQAEYGWQLVRNAALVEYERQQRAVIERALAEREEELRREGAAAERERIGALLRLLAQYRAEYGTKSDLSSDNYALRQNALLMSVSIDTMRNAASIVETNDLEEAKGYLPSWRWGGAELDALGFTEK